MATILMALAVFTALSFAAESLFTGIADPIRARLRGERVDWHLPCHTQLWGVLVYGVSATVSYPCLSALLPEFYGWPWYLRGCCYMLGIYGWEYFWGSLQETTIGFCSWQYLDSPYRILRVTSLTHAPFWFGFGLLLEWTWLVLVPAIMASVW